jgi:hypothetical protein
VYFGDADICNGGFRQLFDNSTGPMAVAAIDGLMIMGRNDVAELIKDALYLQSLSQNLFVNLEKPEKLGIGKLGNLVLG